MPQRDPYTDEVIRPERALLLIAVALFVGVSITVAIFYPSAVSEVPDWEFGLIAGLVLFVIFVGFAAVVVMGRYYAPKAGGPNKQYECTTPEVIHLEPPPYTIPEGQMSSDPSVSEEVRTTLDSRAGAVRPGVNEFGEYVPWGAMRLGGWRIGKSDRWETAGKDGFLLLIGRDDYPIEGYENRWFTSDPVLVRHEEVHPNVLVQLKKMSGGDFIPYKTPLFRLPAVDPVWVEHYRKSNVALSVVLDRLGIPGLAAELAQSLRRSGVAIGDPAEVAKALEPVAKRYLDLKGANIERLRFDMATAPYAWSLYRGAQAEASRNGVDLRIAQGHITELRAALRGDDLRQMRVMTGSGYSATRSPRQQSGALEDVAGYRMRDEGGQ